MTELLSVQTCQDRFKVFEKRKHKCQRELQTNKQITKVLVENDPCYISIPWGTHHWKV
jgi:hypothetical protein